MKTVKCLIFACVLTIAAHAQAAHTATYNVTASGTGCTTAVPCNMQVWRAILPSGNCPAVGNAAYTELLFDLTPTTQTATGSTWTYVDSGTALSSGSTYCAYETATLNSGGGPVATSTIFQGQIPSTPTVTMSGTVTLK